MYIRKPALFTTSVLRFLSETFNTTEQQNKAIAWLAASVFPLARSEQKNSLRLYNTVPGSTVSRVNSSHTDYCNRRFPKCPLQYQIIALKPQYSVAIANLRSRRRKRYFLDPFYGHTTLFCEFSHSLRVLM